MTATAFYIPDTSPLFAYSPCTNCGSATGWLSAYSPRGDGFDQTFHQSLSAQATVAFNLSASSFEVQTSGSASDCGLEYSINGSSFSSACGSSAITNLPLGVHQVVLRPQTASKEVQFRGIIGSARSPRDVQYRNRTIDASSSSAVSYSTGWTSLSSTTSSSPTPFAADFPDLSSFYNGTASVTTQAVAWANYTFGNADAIYLYGVSDPKGGVAEVYLDGTLQNRLNLTNPWRSYSSLIYVTHGLNPSANHTISIVNTQAGGQLVLDYAVIFRPVSDTIPVNLPVLLGGISAGVAACLAIGAALFIWLSRRRDRARMGSANHPYGFATGLSGKGGGGSLSSASSAGMSNSAALEKWRRINKSDASVKSGEGGLSGLSPITPFSAPLSSGAPRMGSAKVNSATGVSAYGQSQPPGFSSSELEYADYIPYNGPISSPPPHTAVTDSSRVYRSLEPPVEPPEIAAHGASATGWLQAQSQVSPRPTFRSNRSEGGMPYSSPRSSGSHRGLTPHRSPFYAASGRASGTSQPPYSAHSSEMSEAQFGTARAVEATRSVARLWPTRDAVPSHYITSELRNAGSPVSLSFMNTDPAARPLPVSRDTSPRSRHAPTAATGAEDPDSPSLRRGVSVKSVKTVRSFFSGLLGQSFGSYTLPSANLHPLQAARPDSDIFPPPSGGGNLYRGDSLAIRSGSATPNVPPTRPAPVLSLGTSTRSLATASSTHRRSSPTNFIIELDVNSPMTEFSRRDSEMTHWR